MKSSLSPSTEEERVVLERWQRDFVAKWGYPSVSLEKLVARWAFLVEEVEKGYQLSLRDYTLELSLRDELADCAARLPRYISHEIERLVAPHDERLRFATDVSSKALAPGVEAGARWWWFALPRQATREFYEELAGYDPID